MSRNSKSENELLEHEYNCLDVMRVYYTNRSFNYLKSLLCYYENKFGTNIIKFSEISMNSPVVTYLHNGEIIRCNIEEMMFNKPSKDEFVIEVKLASCNSKEIYECNFNDLIDFDCGLIGNEIYDQCDIKPKQTDNPRNKK